MNTAQSNDLINIEIHGASIQLPRQTVINNWLASIAANEAPSRTACTPPPIGEIWASQGGVYAGLMCGENGQPDYHLIVPRHEQARIEEIVFGGSSQEVTGSTHRFDGLANTRALVEAATDHPAAQWAAGLSLHGFNDWYLPARGEFALCYANVPELFERTGWYWSSTQYSANNAWYQDFGNGYQSISLKGIALRARAVRRFISHSPL